MATTMTDSQLARLLYSSGDFQQALSALTFLQEECDFDARHTVVELRRFRCFEAAAIVAFARPFEGSRCKTVLGLKQLRLELSASERILYVKLLALRRKVVAHSDEELMRFQSLSIAPFEDVAVRFPALRFNESLLLSVAEVKEFEQLLHKLLRSIASITFAVANANPDQFDISKNPSENALGAFAKSARADDA
jgi:hypothetical protein